MDKHTKWKIEQVRKSRSRIKAKWDEIFGRIVRETRDQMFFDDKELDWLMPTHNPGKWLRICQERADLEWAVWKEGRRCTDEES